MTSFNLSNMLQNALAVATLMGGSGTAMLDKLTSRATFKLFDYSTLFLLFVMWFPMTCLTLGSAIAGGIFVPTL